MSKKVMFICTGNTCRSAMAEGLFKKMLQDRNRTDVEVYSAGIQASTGEYSTDEAIIVMKEDYDVNLLQHKIFTIKGYAYGPEIQDEDIQDPWGYPVEVYRKCAKEIYEALEKIIEKI